MLQNSRHTPESSHTEHPYLYGQALGIFHANVSYIGLLPNGSRSYIDHCIDVIWVRWYKLYQAGGESGLNILEPRPLGEGDTLSFIDPAAVLRAVHLIPRFVEGTLNENVEWVSLLPSWLHYPGIQSPLWKFYYINRQVHGVTEDCCADQGWV
jgi:hypothetical protein